MKRTVLIVGAICAATIASADAQRKSTKPAKPTTPTLEEPVVTDDLRLGDPLSEVCLDPAAAGRTLDGKDNLFIVGAAAGQEALLHLSSCPFNALLFANGFAVKGGGCARVGSHLLFAGAVPADCRIRQINRWNEELGHVLQEE